MSADDSEGIQLVQALAHPLRRCILEEMQGEKEMSPKELSRRLDKPLSNVSYHVRALAKCEAIVLTRTRPARGSEEHFYRVAFDAKWPYEVLGLAPPPDSR